VILIGGNDFADKRGDVDRIRTRFRENLGILVRRCHEAGIRVLLLQYPEPKAADMARVWTHLDDGNDIIAAVAAEEGAETLALAPAFAAEQRSHPLETLLNPTDGVHLQPYGEIVVARAVLGKLRELSWLTPRE